MSESRLERIDPAATTGAQKDFVDRLIEVRGRIPTPYNIWLHAPRLAEGMEVIGTHIDTTPVLTEAEIEVAILATAVHWRAAYVIANHRRHALKAGLPEAVVTAILEGRRPPESAGRLGVVQEAVTDLIAGGAVDAARFARYRDELGRAAIAELLVVIGYFTSASLAMTFHDMTPRA